MKKIYFFALLIFYSCNNIKPNISPPEWILGYWEDIGENHFNKVRFYEDNIIFYTFNSEINYNEFFNDEDIDFYQENYKNIDGKDVYKIKIKDYNTNKVSEMTFTDNSNDELMYKVDGVKPIEINNFIDDEDIKIKDIDKNNDGLITQEELDIYTNDASNFSIDNTSIFNNLFNDNNIDGIKVDEIDSDKSGTLTNQELQSYIDNNNGIRVEDIDINPVDTNITRQEANFYMANNNNLFNINNLFNNTKIQIPVTDIDIDMDNFLSDKEMKDYSDSNEGILATDIDTDSDNIISKIEIQNYRKNNPLENFNPNDLINNRNEKKGIQVSEIDKDSDGILSNKEMQDYQDYNGENVKVNEADIDVNGKIDYTEKKYLPGLINDNQESILVEDLDKDRDGIITDQEIENYNNENNDIKIKMKRMIFFK